jgi:hypothetical protein
VFVARDQTEFGSSQMQRARMASGEEPAPHVVQAASPAAA